MDRVYFSSDWRNEWITFKTPNEMQMADETNDFSNYLILPCRFLLIFWWTKNVICIISQHSRHILYKSSQFTTCITNHYQSQRYVSMFQIRHIDSGLSEWILAGGMNIEVIVDQLNFTLDLK